MDRILQPSSLISVAFLLVSALALACDGPGVPIIAGGSSVDEYTAFANPERVTLTGYAGHAMEPFVSRDGGTLFFNDEGPDKDIFYATRVDDTTFLFQGEIAAINTPAVDGVPTMDDAGGFYYVSIGDYVAPAYESLYAGTWTGATVIGAAKVPGISLAMPGFVNFDVEVSPDGTTLYFTDGDFRGGNNFPDADDLVVAVDSGSGFARLPNSAALMAAVNTVDLEYAAAISRDGLELFFTRLDIGTLTTTIYRVTRTATDVPFESPELVSAIRGFVEGPAFSPDERSLYYHKRNQANGLFELWRVTRP